MSALADLATNAERRNQMPIMRPELKALLAGEEARLGSMSQETPMSFNQANAYAQGNARQLSERMMPGVSL